MSKKTTAKRVAWQKKQEEHGKNIVKWIFGGLIVLAIVYLFWAVSMMS